MEGAVYMIGITKQEIGGVPSLVVVDSQKESDALPLITYFHGFTSAKEHNLPLAFLLAEKGYRVVLPDSQHHGERGEHEVSPVKRQLAFFHIVMQNIKELELIKNHFQEAGLILDGRIGLAGTSMGGITTAAALTQYPWIKTAAVLMGSPKLTSFAKFLIASYREKLGDLPITEEEIEQLYDTLTRYDLSMQVERLNDRPLLFWHGDQDPTVPFDDSYSFYQQAKMIYNNVANIHFLREKNRGHKVSRYAIVETAKWFTSHL